MSIVFASEKKLVAIKKLTVRTKCESGQNGQLITSAYKQLEHSNCVSIVFASEIGWLLSNY